VSDLVDDVGAVVAHYEYGPFGETVVATGSLALANQYRFSTKVTDDETGLVYYGYRYYAPEVGRWLSRDPIGLYGVPVFSDGMLTVPQSAIYLEKIVYDLKYWWELYLANKSSSFGKYAILKVGRIVGQARKVVPVFQLKWTNEDRTIDRIKGIIAWDAELRQRIWEAGSPYLFCLNGSISKTDLLGLISSSCLFSGACNVGATCYVSPHPDPFDPLIGTCGDMRISGCYVSCPCEVK
jgi:RHS repeat-associated protein